MYALHYNRLILVNYFQIYLNMKYIRDEERHSQHLVGYIVVEKYTGEFIFGGWNLIRYLEAGI